MYRCCQSYTSSHLLFFYETKENFQMALRPLECFLPIFVLSLSSGKINDVVYWHTLVLNLFLL